MDQIHRASVPARQGRGIGIARTAWRASVPLGLGQLLWLRIRQPGDRRADARRHGERVRARRRVQSAASRAGAGHGHKRDHSQDEERLTALIARSRSIVPRGPTSAPWARRMQSLGLGRSGHPDGPTRVFYGGSAPPHPAEPHHCYVLNGRPGGASAGTPSGSGWLHSWSHRPCCDADWNPPESGRTLGRRQAAALHDPAHGLGGRPAQAGGSPIAAELAVRGQDVQLVPRRLHNGRPSELPVTPSYNRHPQPGGPPGWLRSIDGRGLPAGHGIGPAGCRRACRRR